MANFVFLDFVRKYSLCRCVWIAELWISDVRPKFWSDNFLLLSTAAAHCWLQDRIGGQNCFSFHCINYVHIMMKYSVIKFRNHKISHSNERVQASSLTWLCMLVVLLFEKLRQLRKILQVCESILLCLEDTVSLVSFISSDSHNLSMASSAKILKTKVSNYYNNQGISLPKTQETGL